MFESVSVVNELSSKRIKDSEERYLLGQNTRIFEADPFIPNEELSLFSQTL